MTIGGGKVPIIPSPWIPPAGAKCRRTRDLESSLGDGNKKVEANEQETVVIQRRSLRAARDLPENDR
jgi:hypothetical protein